MLHNDGKQEHRIIIEYDGFKEHFKDAEGISEFNYRDYYREEDVYREKVLEDYGYKFLRINRFNLGDNPISTLDKRLKILLEQPPTVNGFLAVVHRTVERLNTGEMKECPKCQNVWELK